MSMGSFDEEEYERREKKISSVDTDGADRQREFEGRIEYTGVDSVEELVAQLKERNEE